MNAEWNWFHKKMIKSFVLAPGVQSKDWDIKSPVKRLEWFDNVCFEAASPASFPF